jgi:hypothetical protein
MKHMLALVRRAFMVCAAIGAMSCGGSNPVGPATPAVTRIIGLSGNLAAGNVTTGTTATATLTVGNSGNTPLTVSSISYPSGFSGAWSGTVAAGGSQNVTVTFAPTASMGYGGTVTVNADQTTGTNTVAASGTGVATPPPGDTIESRIDGTFVGWSGETMFPLENGQCWLQAASSSYSLYASHPKVVITKVGSLYEMSVEGVTETVTVALAQYVVKSQIDGTFTGWTGTTTFSLTNGQMWQQSVYAYVSFFAVRPNVVIGSLDGATYRMGVDGLLDAVAVKRIQ